MIYMQSISCTAMGREATAYRSEGLEMRSWLTHHREAAEIVHQAQRPTKLMQIATTSCSVQQPNKPQLCSHPFDPLMHQERLDY